jgi:hypothetical protein
MRGYWSTHSERAGGTLACGNSEYAWRSDHIVLLQWPVSFTHTTVSDHTVT